MTLMFATRIESMRFFWFLTLAGSLIVTATVFVGSDRAKTVAQAKEPARIDEKKADEKKLEEKKTDPKKSDSKIDKHDEELLGRAQLTTDGKALVDFLHKRTLPKNERAALEHLVRQFRSPDYRLRDKATLALIGRGVAALEVLRNPAAKVTDSETTRRIERTIAVIHEKDVAPEVPAAAVRVAAEQNPPGLVETLIAYLPVADNEATLEELRIALTKCALRAGKADPLLVAALTDPASVRRATAGEVLARTAYAGQKDALKKMLGDPDPFVRYRLARALAFAQDPDAIPTLIDTLPDLPLNAAWQAEDFLLKLTSSNAPLEAMGNSKEAREKCKTAWRAWWKKHGATFDLAKLEDPPRLLGRTLIVLLDQSTVLELGSDNLPRWELKGLALPLDAQLIGENRVLVAEYHANCVRERNLRGEVIWEKAVPAPQVAQRLSNGNTFVATAYQLLEFDKDNDIVLRVSISTDGQQKIMKAVKLENGEIVCLLAEGRIVRFDARGNELGSFPINLGMRLYGGRLDVLPGGRILVPHNAEGKVIEYDSRGKIVWEVAIEQPIAAMRLSNGNTLVTSMNPEIGAIEVDRAGTEVWSYHARDSRVTRAIRR
jgi:HEAT repeat protein